MSKQFSQLIKNCSVQPSDELKERIDNKRFPLAQNNLFYYLCNTLAHEEFERCANLYEKRLASKYGYDDDLSSSLLKRFYEVKTAIQEIEAPYKKELEELASKTIKETNSVPDYIEIEGTINPFLSFEDLKEVESNEEEEEEEEDDEEMFDEETLKEFEEYLEENDQEEEIPFVFSYAINFPILLHEINKEVLEILNVNCIPQHLTEEQLEEYYEKADNYGEEIWHYFFGPSLWNHLISFMNKTKYEIKDIFFVFSFLSYKELTNFMIDVVEDQQKAIDVFEEYLKNIDNDEKRKEEESLENEIEKRRILNSIIHGSSIHVWKSIYYLTKDNIEQINSNLISLYNEYSSIVSIMLWKFSPSFMEREIDRGNAITQGFSKLEW